MFLIDEPLSNLDAKLRVQMRSEVLRVHRSIGAATLYVTHDQTEAMTMGDRVAVLQGGVLQQYGTPRIQVAPFSFPALGDQAEQGEQGALPSSRTDVPR